MPDTALETGDTIVNKCDQKISASMEFTFLLEEADNEKGK